MKTFTARIMIVIVLVAVAEVTRQGAAIEERLATAQEQLTTTAGTTPAADADLDASVTSAKRVPVIGPRIERAVRFQHAEAAYWRRDYAALKDAVATPAGRQDANPALQLLATNAAYRSAVLQQRTSQALARSLDDVLKGYASVLETAPDLRDAAYNYEFVVRLRTALASSRDAMPEPKNQGMQGEKGEPPQATRKSDFNIIVPLRPDERKDLPAGAGSELKRKG